jgi:2-phospho-L-lactate guanylyltransferase
VRTAAVLPIKSFSHAKQRLGDAVGGEQRRDLAAAMAADVLAALAAVPEIRDVVVVTAEPLAARAAQAAGATVVDDPDEAGQSAAAGRGIDAALARGGNRDYRVVVVPGADHALRVRSGAGVPDWRRPAPRWVEEMVGWVTSRVRGTAGS